MQTVDQIRSGNLAGARSLKLSCGLSRFPEEIFDLSDTLEILDLSGNALFELPDDFVRLKNLQALFCYDNQFAVLPEVLSGCPELKIVGFRSNSISYFSSNSMPPKLRWLILTDNMLEELPGDIGNCSQLQKLMLAGNNLLELPETLANCSRLELIRISANKIRELPASLLTLPRLSWLSYSGNSFVADSEDDAFGSLSAEIPWSSLDLEDVLGQGTSGIVHSANFKNRHQNPRSVAIKLFKDTLTSDGFPRSEMAASIKAGFHPNLIGTLGRVNEHPQGASGLIMQLVRDDFKRLADPPSLESCTRDVYPLSINFDLPIVFRIARSVASAAQHLHSLGIMHGDIYGHNVLYSVDGNALLCDFGAASFYDRGNISVSQRLEQIEVRAYGCLLEELIDRCNDAHENSCLYVSLHRIMKACLSDKIEERPLFQQISAQLADAV